MNISKWLTEPDPNSFTAKFRAAIIAIVIGVPYAYFVMSL